MAAGLPGHSVHGHLSPNEHPPESLLAPTDPNTPSSLCRSSASASSLLASAAPPYPDPSPVALSTTTADPFFSPTPRSSDNSHLNDHHDMNLLVGGALAPVSVHVPAPLTPSPTKTGPGLRLPSFESMGITSPPPDLLSRLAIHGHTASDVWAAPSAPNLSADVDPIATPTTGGRAIQSPVKHYVATLTPPAEAGEPNWSPTVTSAPIDSPNTDPVPAQAPMVLDLSSSPVASSQPAKPPLQCNTADRSWIQGAVDALVVDTVQNSAHSMPPLRILSHALPSPSIDGHIYPTILGSIHDSTPGSPTVWINLFHAVSGSLTLSDLLTSPPATPGPAVGGDDYFTQKIFGSAVPISDYSGELSALPRSPHPVVPPDSINISVVERYVPPATTNEFADMFNPSGASILVDRMIELTPSNGNLVFIYPTRKGARTFMQHYLGPVLDPVLRSMCVVHGLEMEFGESLGQMPAADKLLEHEGLETQLHGLCDRLSQGVDSIPRIRGGTTRFQVVYAEKKEVVLDRTAWAADWWTKQEKPRVREVVNKFANRARARQASEKRGYDTVSPPEIIKEVLQGVIKKPYPAGRQPEKGIEVSVFVVRRTTA